ncbi:MAG: hypothetical protein WCE75_16950, partial [Terracidiphilus sp.]
MITHTASPTALFVSNGLRAGRAAAVSLALVAALCHSNPASAQAAQPEAPEAALAQSASQPLPSLMRFEGALPASASRRVTLRFSIYGAAVGQPPLWQELQTVETDAAGRFAVLLGADSTSGLPAALF